MCTGDILEDAHHGAFKLAKSSYVRTWDLKWGRAFVQRGLITGRPEYMYGS